MLAHGITPTQIPLPPHSGLLPGNVTQTVVQGQAGETWVELGPVRVSLESAGLPAGTAVRVEIVSVDGALQLRVSPQAGAVAGAPATDATVALLAGVLESLGVLDAERLAPLLLPRQLPANAAAFQALAALFAGKTSLSGDLAQILVLLQDAQAAGQLPQDMLDAFTSVLAQIRTGLPEEFKGLLETLQQKPTVEAQLAKAVQAGRVEEFIAFVQRDLRNQLTQLRGRDALIAYLRARNQLRSFERAVGRVMERLTGAEVQNTRSLEQPYQFIEVPLAPNAELSRAQIHFFEDGEQRGKGKRGGHTVVLDLGTATLGDLWITLRTAAGVCQCGFRAVREEVAALIEGHAKELEAALEKAGYRRVLVTTTTWDGNRSRETAELMRRFAQLDMNA